MKDFSYLQNALPLDVEGINDLIGLALDLRWSWNHATDAIWHAIDPQIWLETRNPWVLLQTVGRERLATVLADADFKLLLGNLLQLKRQAQEKMSWFQSACPSNALSAVAYFSMEFMLSESLPIYSGGLGNVAGDQLKGASDLGIPVVGVGLLYQRGYFRQLIDSNGNQQAVYPFNDPGQLPIVPLRGDDGNWLRFQLELPGHSIWVRAWHVQVGRVPLYLLDTNDASNFAPYRGITGELYSADPEVRLMQEFVLGVGGWRLLSLLGITPDVCHLNEGHAAFAVLERARQYMVAHQVTFDVAMMATRAGNLFTTHTAVSAGFDRFAPDLISKYLSRYIASFGLSVEQLMSLGRQHPQDSAEFFNMAYLAIRASGAVNAVSRLHGQVSRILFSPLFPRWPEAEVPVGYVTNGVHMPSWDSAAADELWTNACEKARWLGGVQHITESIRQLDDQRLWEFRSAARAEFIDFVVNRLRDQLDTAGADQQGVMKAMELLNPNVLTIGFARRFAAYKRPNLLLQDPERLIRLLSDPQRPVQLVVAGKAHPADIEGQRLVRQWNQFIQRPEVRPHVVFLTDYDMLLAEKMVQGLDLWLNTPRRPWEACGTSGMKVLVNGGLNLSELDGWWAEAFTPDVGWALGDGNEHTADPDWDAKEAEALYQILEAQVIPTFYSRTKEGIPQAWVARVRESMARLTPAYSTNRSLPEYVNKYYLPLAQGYRDRTKNNNQLAAELLELRASLDDQWKRVGFGDLVCENRAGKYWVEAQIYLSGVDPTLMTVELFANSQNESGMEIHEMSLMRPLTGVGTSAAYAVLIDPKGRPFSDYTVRVRAKIVGCATPLEVSHILWHH